MRTRSLAIPLILTAALLAGGAGCGDGESSGTTSTEGSAPIPSAVFTFGEAGLAPAVARVRIDRGRLVDLTIVSADGRPHGVVVEAGGTRVRVVVSPGATARRRLRNVTRGRYRVEPDGAADPVLMIVDT